MVAADLHPAEIRSRRTTAFLVEDLLKRHTQADYGTALRLIPALGTNHQSASRIREAIDEAWNADQRLTVGPKNLKDLQAAGIEPKKRNLSEKARKKAEKRGGLVTKAARGIAKRMGSN